jgi:hypothetical protein
MKKIIYLCTSIFLTTATLCAETKSAEVVFKKWTEWQHIFKADKNIEEMAMLVDDSFLPRFKQKYELNLSLLRYSSPFLSVITDGQINEYGHNITSPVPIAFLQNLKTIYSLIQSDMSGFVNFLKKSNFVAPAVVRSEADGSSHDVIEKDNALFELLFAQQNDEQKEEFLFATASRFFEYCFSEKTFPEFQRLLLTKELYPIARLLYAVTWFRLAGSGWKNWSAESLQILKEKSDQGHQIVYIAGGSDIFQMLKAGVYNIKNIDPQLPSQPKYYADGWTWLIRGDGANNGIGDNLVLTNNEGKKIIMQRTDYQEDGTTFNVRIATGQVITLPHSTTTWNIFDEDGGRLGAYVLERRFVKQEDFIKASDKTFLMSFNELFYISLPDFMDGWGIEPNKFSDDLNIVIKQLRRPVSKKMICNMRIADLLNNSDFKFISLGACIN